MENTLTRVRWEKTTENAPDLHPFLNATIAALAAGGIATSATALQNASGRWWYVLFGLLVALITFLIYFTLLLARQSQLGQREWTVETPVVPPVDGGQVRLMVPADSNPKQLRATGYTFTEGQITRLAAALYRGGWMFNRDTVRGSRAFAKSDYDNWPWLLKRFQNAELVDGQRRVTGKGVALFAAYLPAPREFQPTVNGSPARPRPPYTWGEGDEDDGSRGVE